MNIPCPHAEKNNRRKLLNPNLEGSSWVCKQATGENGNPLEFYKITGGKVMTREEFFEIMPEGTKTVPQIFIDEKYIGGYEDLVNANILS